jgi:hypothetical protein
LRPVKIAEEARLAQRSYSCVQKDVVSSSWRRSKARAETPQISAAKHSIQERRRRPLRYQPAAIPTRSSTNRISERFV